MKKKLYQKSFFLKWSFIFTEFINLQKIAGFMLYH